MPNYKRFKSHQEYLEYYRQYRQKNAKKLREYNRKYNKLWRKENGYENEKNSKKRYPEKEYARRLLGEAVRRGKVVKKECCVCGEINSQGHHDDYFKPLDVIWLCAIHHKDRHRKLKIM